MSEVYLPMLAALAGGLISALASLGPVWLQGRRNRMNLVTDLALADYDQLRKTAELHRTRTASLVAFLYYYVATAHPPRTMSSPISRPATVHLATRRGLRPRLSCSTGSHVTALPSRIAPRALEASS